MKSLENKPLKELIDIFKDMGGKVTVDTKGVTSFKIGKIVYKSIRYPEVVLKNVIIQYLEK